MITSNQNQAYKHLVKLKKRKYRIVHHEAVIYGDDIILTAKSLGIIKYTIGPDESYDVVMSEALIQSLAEYDLHTKALAVIEMPSHLREDTHNILILDNVQDPKNVGALIRSAEAFGFLNVFLGMGSADPFHEEAIRAAKGSTFKVRLIYGEVVSFVQSLIHEGLPIVLTSKEGEILSHTLNKPLALVLGNEGMGINPVLYALKHHALSIPTQGVESLNVSVAGGISMYILRG